MESSLTTGQLTNPPLEQMKALEEKILLHQKNRDTGTITRKSGNLTLTVATAPLLDLVQICACVLTATQFELTVSPNLGSWGFKVQKRAASTTTAAKSEVSSTSAPVTGSATTSGSTTTAAGATESVSAEP